MRLFTDKANLKKQFSKIDGYGVLLQPLAM